MEKANIKNNMGHSALGRAKSITKQTILPSERANIDS